MTAHSVTLLQNPELAKLLTPLYQTIEARVSAHRKLLKLSGRLDLALAQTSIPIHLGGEAAPVFRDETGADSRAVDRSHILDDEEEDEDEDEEGDDDAMEVDGDAGVDGSSGDDSEEEEEEDAGSDGESSDSSDE